MKISVNASVVFRCYNKINKLGKNRKINTILKEIKPILEECEKSKSSYVELDNKLRNKILKVLKVNNILLYSHITNEDVLSDLNDLCVNCKFEDCQFKNCRDLLKLQTINFRQVKCQLENEMYIIDGLAKKLP